MDNAAGLVSTIAILAGCLVYLSKAAMEVYKRKKTGKLEGCVEVCAQKVGELHQWHCPITDPVTNQPRFPWYENNAELLKELIENRESMNSLEAALVRTQDTMERLISAMENLSRVRELTNK